MATEEIDAVGRLRYRDRLARLAAITHPADMTVKGIHTRRECSAEQRTSRRALCALLRILTPRPLFK